MMWRFIFVGVMLGVTHSYSDSDVTINEIKNLDRPSIISIQKDRRFAVASQLFRHLPRITFDESNTTTRMIFTSTSTSTTTEAPTTTEKSTTQKIIFAPAKDWIVSPSTINETSRHVPLPVQAGFPIQDPMTILQQGQMLNPMFRGMSPFGGGGMPMPVSPVVGYQEFLSRFMNPFQPVPPGYPVPVKMMPETPVVETEPIDDASQSVDDVPDKAVDSSEITETHADDQIQKSAVQLAGGCMQNCEKTRTRDHCTVVCNPGPTGNTGKGTFFQWNNPF